MSRRRRWSCGFLSAMALFAATAATHHGCGAEQPGVHDDKFANVTFTHEGHIDNGCIACHESIRPSPGADGTPHGKGKDCVGCHSPSDSQGPWAPAHPFTHDPAPATCLPCHTKERPAPPHAAAGDCANCHQFPKWQ